MQVNNPLHTIQIQSEPGSSKAQIQPENQNRVDARVSVHQWLSTGQLFQPGTKSPTHEPKDFLSNGLTKILADLSSESTPLSSLIDAAETLVIATSQSTNPSALLQPENRALLETLQQQSEQSIKKETPSEHQLPSEKSGQLSELRGLLRELNVQLGHHATQQLTIPGASVASSLQAIGEYLDTAHAQQAISTATTSPALTDFINQTLSDIDQLKQHLNTQPKDRTVIQQALGEDLSTVVTKASNTLSELANHSQNPQLREALTDLSESIITLTEKDPSGKGPSGKEPGWFAKVAGKTDIYAALSPENDKEFKQILRQDLSTTIEQWNEHNQELGSILDRADFPPKMKKRYMELCDSITHDLNALKNGVPVKERLLRGAGTLLAYPLPLAIPLHTGEKQYSSTLIPHFVKNGMLLLGLMSNDTSGKQVYSDHFNNRLFVNTVIGAVYAIPTFLKPAEFLRHSIGFNMGAAAATGISTFAQFNMDKTKELVDKVTDMLFSTDNSNFTINNNAKAELRDFISTLKQEKETLSGLKENFTGNGDKNLSDTLNSQMSHVLSVMDQLNGKLEGAMGEAAPEAVNTVNADFYPKMGLTALTAVIAAATIGLMYPDPIGIVDYVVDGALIISEMWKQMSNPNVDLQDAVKTLKDLVGLNLTMTLYLSANKGLQFLDMGAKGYWAGTAAMTAANLTVPGMVGGAAGNVIGQALGYLQHKWSGDTPPPAELEEIVVEQPGMHRTDSASSARSSVESVSNKGPALEEIVIDRPGSPRPLAPEKREAPVAPSDITLDEIVIT